MTERWLEHLADELDVSGEVPLEELLDTARVVAHTVERRAAPLTTFMIGLAAAKDPASTPDLCRRVRDLAEAWDSDG